MTIRWKYYNFCIIILPLAEVLEELIYAVYHVLYYALNLLYLCTSVFN